MDNVYLIGGLFVYGILYFTVRKIFLDRSFKKFDKGNGNYYFKASVLELIFQRLIISIPLTLVVIYSIVISMDFHFGLSF
jgi:ABC-type microcin C transport system permease subunit YejB